MKEFKIRCSAIGSIMGSLKGGLTDNQLKELKRLQEKEKKTDKQKITMDELATKLNQPKVLPETCKTYCKDWLKWNLYGKRKEIKSKYLDKGNLAEDHAIELIQLHHDLSYNEKNEEFFSSDYITGTPDLIYSNLVIDAKCSFDCYTFPLFNNKIPNKDYYYQLQGYMSLTGKDKAMLCYCLVDMPLTMVEQEAYWQSRRAGFDSTNNEIFNDVLDKRSYSNIGTNLRVKSYSFDYDANFIDQVEKRVELCRDYIKELMREFI